MMNEFSVSALSTFVETAEHISLPDDCTVGYIVEALLGVSLTRSPLFHSHLENLDLVSDVHSQVDPCESDTHKSSDSSRRVSPLSGS